MLKLPRYVTAETCVKCSRVYESAGSIHIKVPSSIYETHPKQQLNSAVDAQDPL